MFTLDENFDSDFVSTRQSDFYGKGIVYFFGVILFFEILRNQISEIDLLQLIPGFYFFLFFISFLFFIIFSDFFLRIPLEIDNIKGYGTKLKNKMELNILLKFSFFLFSTLLGIILNTVIPLSLDSFNSSSQKTLENTWSINEVLYVEITLLIVLIIISQIPLFFVFNFNTQNFIRLLSQFWKILVILITLVAGFLTPTLDGYKQVSFAISTFSFYLLIVNILQKRMLLKLNIFLPFG
jgi:hypothetical protein